MKFINRLTFHRRTCAAVALLCLFAGQAFGSFDNYITREGSRLYDGEEVFRFAGIHMPELHRIEDDAKGVCKADPRGWGQYFKWPTPQEQENWIKSLVRTGHKAMRVYVLSVATPFDNACGRETHILPPTEPGGMPVLNETAMRHYDRMIALADEYQLRLILPFIDHWQWWGGREQLAAFYGESGDDFYRLESQTYKAYTHIITQVLTRKNTLTGRPYNREKAIMAWETGNELKGSTAEFVGETAALIKRIAPDQLVVDGTYLKIIPESLTDPNVDIISNHFYTTNNNNRPEQVSLDLAAVGGKKAYMVGEFGLRDAAGLHEIMQAVVFADYQGHKASGAFIWGGRGHRHNGGFYWHREYNGHFSYHLPGFPEGESNQEQAVIDLVRLAQAQQDGQSGPPPLPVPEPPVLREITEVGALRWLGAPVGRYYRIERSVRKRCLGLIPCWSEWITRASDLSDGMQQYDPAQAPLYLDEQLTPGLYRYRVFAGNESGESAPSNIQTFRVEH